jgi:hypothetical protein
MNKRGNGAREALQKILGGDVVLSDHLLVLLWLEGFVVKPLSDAELNPKGK